MFGTNKEKKTEDAAREKVNYDITVLAARATKNERIVMIDILVNGIEIKSCMLKEITVTKDGTKYKKGDTCYMLNFPSEKVGDKYYNRVWFPVSNESMEVILKQTESLLAK